MSKVDSGNVVSSEAYLAELRDAVEHVRLRHIRREAEANEARGFWKGVCIERAASLSREVDDSEWREENTECDKYPEHCATCTPSLFWCRRQLREESDNLRRWASE